MMKKRSSKTNEVWESEEEKLKDDFVSITEDVVQQKRSWTDRLNPLKWVEIPPVPDCDAGLIPELHANWFSKLTFGWMAPLMMVHSVFDITEIWRKATRGRCKRRTFGGTMRIA